MRTWSDGKTHKDPYGKPITFIEWYNTHDSAKPYRDRVMKAINQLHFKSVIWEPVQDGGISALADFEFTAIERFRLFVDDVRMVAGMQKMSTKMYNEGIKYREPFSKNYDYALEEMWLLCWGDW